MISFEYIILFAFILIAVFTKSKIWTYIAIITMLVLGVCRDRTVGTDFYDYIYDFRLIQNVETASNVIRHSFEIGFIWLIYLYKKFTTSYLLFGSIIFLPFFFGCLKLIKDSRVNYAYAIFVLYTYGLYFSAYNIMRQMMCIGIILFFISWLYKQKYLKFAVAIVICSTLFHKSSIILLLTIPIHYYTQKIERINKKLLYVCVLSSFAIYFLGSEFFIEIFSTGLSFLGMSRYGSNYLTIEGEGGNTVSAMYTLFALIVIYCKNPDTAKFQTYTFIASIVIFNLFNIMPTYASRIFWGLFIFSIVLIPDMLTDKGTRHKKIFFASSVLIVSFHEFKG